MNSRRLQHLAALLCTAAALAMAPTAGAHERTDPRLDQEVERHVGRWRAWFPSFTQVNLVANKTGFGASIVEPRLQNAWGIAIRPAGLGGHFWVTANTVRESIEYVGDVGGVPLFQDDLKVVGTVGTPTGVVFNGGAQFVVTQAHAAGPIVAPAKFLFANDSGEISAWTERARAGGGFDRPSGSVVVVDGAAKGSAFFGIGLSPQGDRLYAADFGAAPALRVYDGTFRELRSLRNPFQRGPVLKPGDYAPFNVQSLGKPGAESVFVMYAKTQPDPNDPNAFYAAEEDAGPGKGRLAEFAPDGRLIAVWRSRGKLNAPWGVALAPDDFGLFGGCLLVGNFGDGTIVAFHPRWKVAIDYLRDPRGQAIKIDGLWGLQFGNGASLGEANHLYFAAGPNGEADGLFGKLVASEASLRHHGGVSLCR
jgi:uncharacterized protein (TIGR03118 family)